MDVPRLGVVIQMSCILFHGPGARVEALNEAFRTGRLLVDPIGDDGLKVEGARQVVGLMLSTPVGSKKGIVVVGPMDRANWQAADVLLKTIEEFNSRVVQPILWAFDLGGVSATIRSRCIDRWCPQIEDVEEDDELVAAGYDLVFASIEGELWQIPEKVKTFKNREHELLGALVDALRMNLDKKPYQELWSRLRDVAMHRNPTQVEILAALLPPVEK